MSRYRFFIRISKNFNHFFNGMRKEEMYPLKRFDQLYLYYLESIQDFIFGSDQIHVKILKEIINECYEIIILSKSWNFGRTMHITSIRSKKKNYVDFKDTKKNALRFEVIQKLLHEI